MTYLGNPRNQQISELSSTAPLAAAGVLTTDWVDVSAFDSIVVAVKTDQDGTYTIQFSPDGTNQDSTLTREYRTAQINAPHRFTVTRSYCRIVFTNDSGADQTEFRLETLAGGYGDLNAPTDSTLAADFDAIVVRPTDYRTEVALGRRQGASLWNKFGYNNDVDVGTEVVAAWGGTFTPLTTATTISIASTSAADDGDPLGTGCGSVVLYGIDANRDAVIEVVTLNGQTPVVTTSTWLGLNRVAMFLCGTGQVNAGTITATAVTGSSIMAQLPAGGGVTQQCIFHVPRNTQFIAEWLWANTVRQASQDPIVTIKMWVFSTANNGKQEVFKADIDTSVGSSIDLNPNLPFPISGNSVIWLEATTDKDNTIVNGRFSGTLINDVSA
tara:strand:+ start:6562 stop:7713 length:1152 start_codon:yes stop_codon:yes gene_type:complete